MKYENLNNRANQLRKEQVESSFYEMVLCYGLESLCDNIEQEVVSDEQFNELLSIMYNYLQDCYRVAPWDVADAITNLIKEIGIDAFLNDCHNNGSLLEDELCNM